MANTIKNNETQTDLKYRIGAELAKFSHEVQLQKRKKIRERCGNLSKGTLSTWINIKSGDARMIPYDHMIVIADELGCKVENLKNN